eukprot:evm.model.scf_891.1 EVM.evm.TU.scf_891.1   scf_891:1779-4952(-)
MDSMPPGMVASLPPMCLPLLDYTAVNAGLSPGGSPPGLSRQRLFVVVYKGVKSEELSRMFRVFPGMEYCDLKKDKKTCKSKGYCYVNYSTHEAAKAAIQALNGIEFPPHSGHRMKVMFAEPLGVKSASPSPGAAGPAGPAYQGTPRPGCGGALGPAGAGLPGQGDLPTRACEGGERGAGSGAAPCLDGEPAHETKVFTMLTRHLPDYAIRHVFAKCGTVEYVRLQKDGRFGVVKFATPEAATAAVQMLNGTDICGEALTVS